MNRYVDQIRFTFYLQRANPFEILKNMLEQKVKSTYPEVPWKSSISQASQPNFACPKRAKRGEKSI